jgi:hypothetical protein
MKNLQDRLRERGDLDSINAADEIDMYREGLSTINEISNHGIPHYAYGDSEAGTYLASYLAEIHRITHSILWIPRGHS